LVVFFVFLLSICERLEATSFQPVSPYQLIKSSDVIVKGTFLKQKYHELPDGKLATEMIFLVEAEVGLHFEAMSDPDMVEVSIWYPGGRKGDRVEKVEGTPRWMPGEQALVLAKSLDDQRLWGLSLSLGSFKLIKLHQREFAINNVYPQDPLMSSWDWARWQSQVKLVKDQQFRRLQSDKYVLNLQHQKEFRPQFETEGKKRSIASLSKSEDNNEHEGMQPVGLLLLLAFMGFVSRIFYRRKR
jgi:hypothetical protein